MIDSIIRHGCMMKKTGISGAHSGHEAHPLGVSSQGIVQLVKGDLVVLRRTIHHLGAKKKQLGQAEYSSITTPRVAIRYHSESIQFPAGNQGIASLKKQASKTRANGPAQTLSQTRS